MVNIMDEKDKIIKRPLAAGFAAASGRLPSFKSPRDLTLVTGIGGTAPLPLPPSRSRRNYVPNIPPKRDRSSGAASRASSTSLPSTSRDAQQNASNRGGRNQNQRERKKKELVQATSIFEEGVGNPLLNPRRHTAPSARARGGASSGSKIESFMKNRDKLKSEADPQQQSNEEVEEGEYTIDFENFISDLDEGPVADELSPVSLPLSHYVEHMELYDSDEEDNKPSPAVVVKSEFPTPPTKRNFPKTSFAHVFNTAEPEDALVFLQLPDHLPVLEEMTTDTPPLKCDDIGTLAEGSVGKIQILESGRAKFILGEVVLDIEPGKLVGFRQELASLDEELKTLTILGQVQYKFTCSPDIDALLQDS